MKNKNVLVTGGAGYIGSHACKALQQAGFNPITVDSLVTGWKDAVKFGPFVNLDLLDKKNIDKIFKLYKPSAVMHFAALSQVQESVENPGLYWKNNVIGSLNLINACIENHCLDFIFSSTCATYGNHDNVVLTEKTEQIPINAYGSSKRAVEEIIKNYAFSAGLRYVIFRYFNVAGADPEAMIGEFHQPETHLIPLLLDKLNKNNEFFTIFGTNYPTPDGTCIRDYIHVCDLIDAHVLGLKWIKDNKKNGIFNIGTRHGFSVLEVIENIRHITKKNLNVKIGKRRYGDCAKLVSGSTLAEEKLNWKPNKSNLKQIITDAWRWHRTGKYQN